MSYVLRETVAESEGRDVWFKQMTGIGPMTTTDKEEAAHFASAWAAQRSIAMSHMLSVFRVEEVETR